MEPTPQPLMPPVPKPVPNPLRPPQPAAPKELPPWTKGRVDVKGAKKINGFFWICPACGRGHLSPRPTDETCTCGQQVTVTDDLENLEE